MSLRRQTVCVDFFCCFGNVDAATVRRGSLYAEGKNTTGAADTSLAGNGNSNSKAGTRGTEEDDKKKAEDVSAGGSDQEPQGREDTPTKARKSSP